MAVVAAAVMMSSPADRGGTRHVCGQFGTVRGRVRLHLMYLRWERSAYRIGCWCFHIRDRQVGCRSLLVAGDDSRRED